METKPQRTSSQLPSTIGRYRVVGRLGKGAMGIVYSAYDDLMDRPVAIKVMLTDVQDDPETSERFYREAHAAGQLVHRNIITIFDLGDDDGRPYIVMELLDSRTLGDYLKRPEGVRLEEKISLMLQLSEGLQLAHGKRIFHRDIKPGNLLISDDGGLKIVDFGIARISTSSMTMSGVIVGTPDYMSPEQARGEEVDERSDLFSAGAVFYYMLTGRKPFAAPDLPTVLDKVQSEDPLPIRDAEAPPALVAIVQRALAKSPAARYQKAAVMWADLLRVERELVLEARRVSDEVRAELDTLAVMSAERRKRCDELNAVPDPTDVARFREGLAQRFPHMSDWLDHRGEASWDCASAHERRREVADIRQALEGELAKLTRAAVDMQSGEKATRTGDFTQALNYFDSALQAIPSSTRAKEESARTRALLAEKQAAEHRAGTLVIEAKNAASRAEWQTVIALTAQALAADASNIAATDLRDRATNSMQSEERARKQQCEKALERAEKLARKGRYAEAEHAIAEARRLDHDSAIVPALEARIRTARLDAERASAAERRAADAIAAARILFDKGERAEALSELAEFLAREPQSQGVSAALTKLRAEADRLAADDRRRSEAAERARAAELALEGNDLERALTLTRQALAGDPKEPLARKVEGMATARLNERALAREREEAASHALQNARALLARGKFDTARDLARKAATLRPGDEEPTALLATILEEESKARQRSEREEDARQRAKAAAPALAMARAAEMNRDFVRAAWLAENALAVDVDCGEAGRILESVRAKISAEPALADETVKVGGSGGPAPDSEDTLTLRPALPVWRRLGETLIRRLAEPLKDKLRGRDVTRGTPTKPPDRS